MHPSSPPDSLEVGGRRISDEGPIGFDTLGRNITLTGGATPARAYIEELLPEVLNGSIAPGRMFDRTIGLDDVPDGYRAIADRQALKVLIDL